MFKILRKIVFRPDFYIQQKRGITKQIFSGMQRLNSQISLPRRLPKDVLLENKELKKKMKTQNSAIAFYPTQERGEASRNKANRRL